MKMKNPYAYGEEVLRCPFHPKELVIGICALCLRERLLILASKQGMNQTPSSPRRGSSMKFLRKPSLYSFPKVSTLGSMLHRLEFLPRRKSDATDLDAASTSLEDSFISIKFEDNGSTSWENGATKQFPWESVDFFSKQDPDTNSKTVVEHAQPRGGLRWRKKMGYLFHLVRWKRSSNKGSNSHMAAKSEAANAKRNWLRTLSIRRSSAD
ncbi:uncharacterized protein LOC116266635 [Nymphaea colorata]|nr:uncharacterized protein LOC116266635 [Nymphaea colorata]